jgi:hypothetical protein
MLSNLTEPCSPRGERSRIDGKLAPGFRVAQLVGLPVQSVRYPSDVPECFLSANDRRAGTIRRRHFYVSSVLWAAVGLAVQGCSTDDELPRQTVSGLIRLDGQPLANGIAHFYPRGSGRSRTTVMGGAMIRNGRFSIPRELGLIPGKYTVAVFSAITSDERRRDNDKSPGNGMTFARELIPAKYNSHSNLEIEITATHLIKYMTIDVDTK